MPLARACRTGRSCRMGMLDLPFPAPLAAQNSKATIHRIIHQHTHAQTYPASVLFVSRAGEQSIDIRSSPDLGGLRFAPRGAALYALTNTIAKTPSPERSPFSPRQPRPPRESFTQTLPCRLVHSTVRVGFLLTDPAHHTANTCQSIQL